MTKKDCASIQSVYLSFVPGERHNFHCTLWLHCAPNSHQSKTMPFRLSISSTLPIHIPRLYPLVLSTAWDAASGLNSTISPSSTTPLSASASFKADPFIFLSRRDAEEECPLLFLLLCTLSPLGQTSLESRCSTPLASPELATESESEFETESSPFAIGLGDVEKPWKDLDEDVDADESLS